MRKDEVRNTEQALLYIADCQLATVEELAMSKSPGVNNYSRQKSIAQLACTWIKDFGITPEKGSRVLDVFTCKGGVEEFAKNLKDKFDGLRLKKSDTK